MMLDFEYPEGATTIDPEESAGLLPTHITTRGELDRWEQDNIVEALAWLDKTKPKDILNEQFVKELHKRMFASVWKWAGQFRQTNKNLGVAWQQIPMSLKNLFDDTKQWIERRQDPPDEIAVRFHHRLVSVHPFSNGNGRHARLMTDLVLENILQGARFTWGARQELSKAGETRSRYIAALRDADSGNYEPLIVFARA
jgi:Fic-DOC domain mobile mystery protein B